jgi:oligopeptide transport system substrate-binding protein
MSSPQALFLSGRQIFRVILAIGLLLAAGCAPRETNVERGDREQVLHRGIGPEIADLDPQLATGTSEYSVLSALFEGLVSEDPVDLHPVPGVAETWEVSSDGLNYTFHLRANATWSDGKPVTADDFLRSWQRVLTPSLGADCATLLYVVQNAESYHKGLLTDFAQVGFAAPDARTVRITLDHPSPSFLNLLNHPVWLPVPVSTIAQYGPVAQRGTPWTRPGRFVGNGPFLLKEWKPNQEIVVEKAPAYWDAARVRLHGIHFHTIESLDAEERAFRTGQLHLTEALPLGKIDTYRRDAPQLLRQDPYLGTYFFRLNVRRPFLNQPAVRRALSLALDRDTLARDVLRGAQLPAAAFTPPGLDGYTPPPLLHTDFAEARRLLAGAGYPGGQGAPPVEILFNTSENHRVIAEAVQEMWRRELGLEVRLANQENKMLLQARRTGDYQVLRSSWIADYADPASFLDLWTSDNGNNHTGWASSDYDHLLFEAARTADPAARSELFRRAEVLLLTEAPILPVYHYRHVFLIQPSVKGWHPTLLDHHPYKYVSLEP